MTQRSQWQLGMMALTYQNQALMISIAYSMLTFRNFLPVCRTTGRRELLYLQIFILICLNLLLPFHIALATDYDEPIKVMTGQSNVGELKCTFYSDLMIRETSVDSPSPGAAVLVSGASPSTGCNPIHVAGEKTLTTDSDSFNGRRGDFLIFSNADPSNAIEFKVLLTNGAVIYTDDMMDDDFQVAEIENGVLHLVFRRGINATCSVLSDSTCWTKLEEAKMLPRVLGQAGPPIKACAASYATAKDPNNDPSIIFYRVDMTVSTEGKPSVKSRGSVGCQPSE